MPPLYSRFKRCNSLYRGIITGVCVGLLESTLVLANQSQNKLNENLARVAATTSYLYKRESYRFQDQIITMHKDRPIYDTRNRELYAAIFWNEECQIFIVLFPRKSLENLSKKQLVFYTAHEVCHAIIHGRAIKEEKYNPTDELDHEADNCAYELIGRHGKALRGIWQ